MGFLTLRETIIATHSDTFDDPAGALSTTKWGLLDVGSGQTQTTRDIEATGTDLREPNTATVAPAAYLLGTRLPHPLTCRLSMSVKSTGATAGAGAFLTIYRPDQPAGVLRLTARVGIFRSAAGIGAPDTFQFRWRGQVTNVAIAGLLASTYYRVGMEIDAAADVARGYLNTTSATDSTGDAGLAPYVTFAIDSGTAPFDDADVFPGVGLSAASNAAKTDYSGAENILIESWLLPFTATFPGGAFFPTLEDPYVVYKSTLTLHERLNRAQLV